MDRSKISSDQLMILLIISDREMSGFEICDALHTLCGSYFYLGWMYDNTHVLEKKGYLKSRLDGATPERDGNRRRFYSTTTSWKKHRNTVLCISATSGGK